MSIESPIEFSKKTIKLFKEKCINIGIADEIEEAYIEKNTISQSYRNCNCEYTYNNGYPREAIDIIKEFNKEYKDDFNLYGISLNIVRSEKEWWGISFYIDDSKINYEKIKEIEIKNKALSSVARGIKKTFGSGEAFYNNKEDYLLFEVSLAYIKDKIVKEKFQEAIDSKKYNMRHDLKFYFTAKDYTEDRILKIIKRNISKNSKQLNNVGINTRKKHKLEFSRGKHDLYSSESCHCYIKYQFGS